MDHRTLLLFVALGAGCSASAPPSPTSSGTEAAPASATTPSAVTLAAARSAQADLDVATFTSAPRRALATARLDAPLEEVWAYVSNHDNLVEYTNGVLESADIDRTEADGGDGVGTRRTCAAGDDRFVERIVYFRAPYVFAYSAVENTWGLENHLATVALRPDGDGTILEWSQYFDMASDEATTTMTRNMQGMLEGRILAFFTERFGGQVGSAG